MVTRPFTLVFSILVVFGVAAVSHGDETRFVQDRFAIGFWVDPPADKHMATRYKEIADANFTVVLGGFGASTPATIRKQLRLCRSLGLKAIVTEGAFPIDQLPKQAACWGYAVRDEPSAKDFPDLKAKVSAIRAARPGKLAYINLFPNYANAQQLGTDSYDEHVARFVQEVDPDVLSMDHYPILRPDVDGRKGYCETLTVMRKYSIEKGIPFWNFFNTMPYGPHSDPTEAQLRWQVYSSIAYGAKGVLYFCYWTPRGGEFPKGGAIITAEGRRTRHYDQAKRINKALRNLGATLMQLSSTGVYRVAPDQDPAPILADTPLRSITPGDYLVGVFQHADGRRAVLLNNYSFAYTAWPTVAFDGDPASVLEVDPATGKEIPVLDDSPAMEGLQLSIDSGEGRLFLLPAK